MLPGTGEAVWQLYLEMTETVKEIEALDELCLV